MNLSFVKEGASYVSEFQVNSDFNLHLETVKVGPVRVYQRGCPEGQYALACTKWSEKVYDYDFGSLVYPKWIKVVSGSEVLNGVVTSDGEVTEAS